MKTSAGTITTRFYDDGCAKGIQIFLDDEIVAILESIHMNDIDKSRLHARIPVIRFEDPITKLQCDLCFNNILPIRNTLLLKTYSFIDPRVRVLGIIIKKW